MAVLLLDTTVIVDAINGKRQRHLLLDELLAQRDKINLQIQEILDSHTEPWGVKVSMVEVKQIDLPLEMQRAIARQAEAERERRAKVINAEGEYQAAARLAEAAVIIAKEPTALQLRFLQTLVEVSAEKNSTIIFPAQFMTTVQEAISILSKDSATK